MNVDVFLRACWFSNEDLRDGTEFTVKKKQKETEAERNRRSMRIGQT